VQSEGGECESCDRVAVKFFLNKRAFATEAKLHSKHHQALMPATVSLQSNSRGAIKAPSGYEFPPFIVMRHGVTLEDWARENKDASLVTVIDVRFCSF
jgi:hypothetical protein